MFLRTINLRQSSNSIRKHIPIPSIYSHPFYRNMTSLTTPDTPGASFTASSIPSPVLPVQIDPFDDPDNAGLYRPYLLPEGIQKSDWVSQLELDSVASLAATTTPRLKFLVLYGSLRERSYSRLMAFEASRILHRLGADVRVFNPEGLPVKDDVQHNHPKVQELRKLSAWSDGHLWCSPEQHGNLVGIPSHTRGSPATNLTPPPPILKTAVFKNQIDWIPLMTGSVRPTQGRTLALIQVSGGSQSFNTVNSLRILGRWMRMWTVPNQSSLPMAWTQFTAEEADEGGSRLMPSGNRDRVVDVVEELFRFTALFRPVSEGMADRFSERVASRKYKA